MSCSIPNFDEPPVKRGPGRPRFPSVLGRTLDDRIQKLRGLGHEPPPKRAVLECARQAIRDLLPRKQRTGKGVSRSMRSQISERVRELLQRHHLHVGLPPEKENAVIQSTIRWLFETYDPDRAPSDFRFNAHDLRTAHSMLGGMLSNATHKRIRAALAERRIKLKRKEVQSALSIAWCTASKNILSRESGALPVTSVAGMLRRYHPNVSRLGSLVAILLSTLEELNLIRCTHRAFGPGFCRRYQIVGASHRLPFVAARQGDADRRAKAELLAREASENEQAGAAAAAGAAKENGITTLPRVFGYAVQVRATTVGDNALLRLLGNNDLHNSTPMGSNLR